MPKNMKILQTHKALKFTFAAFAIAGMLVTSFAYAIPRAEALTQNELNVICVLLNCDTSQRSALQALVSGSGQQQSFTFTRDLTVGSVGEDVRQLQIFLNNQGFAVNTAGAPGSQGNETTYFGSLTRTALAQYQAANGIQPSVGYFGPITRTNVNAKLATVVQPPVDDGDDDNDDVLEGGAGSLSDVDYVSKLSGEEVGEGEEDVEVAGLEIEADDSSDIEILAVNLNFSQETANRDFDRYADEVSVWFEGDEVARIDADEFEDDDNFNKTITLGSGNIIRAGDTAELVVAVSGISNLDSADEGEIWTLEFESVRFRDAQNAIITDSSTGDINDGAGRTFSFESFASAANISLRVSSGGETINDARTIIVDSSNDTDNVELFSFELEAEGNSDITIDDMPVLFTSVGAGVGQIVNTVELWIEGDLVGSESVSSTADTSRTIVFDNLDFTIDSGDTVEVIVRADVNNLDSNFTEGDTLSVEFGETQTDSSDFDVEDENGNNLEDADIIGSASSDEHVFYESALEISNVNTSVSVQDVSNSLVDVKGVYTVAFDVTAVGSDVYLATTTGSTTNGSNGIEWSVKGSTFSGSSSSNLSSSASRVTSGGAYKVRAGQTERFTLVVALDNQSGPSGFYGVEVDRIQFVDSDDTGFAENSGFLGDISNYTSVTVGLDDLETNNVNLN